MSVLTDKDWRVAPLGEIIDFIIPRFHDKHRNQLPILIELAEKVEVVHAESADYPKGLTVIIRKIYADLVNHMMKEEQILFPLIKAGRGTMAAAPISVMEAEHDEAGNDVEQIQKLTNNFTPPADACTSWCNLYQGLQEFATDLDAHVDLENKTLFPRALAGEHP